MEELEFRYDTQLLIDGEDLDEDEMYSFMNRQYSSCPYFHLGDEYKIVQKQN